MQTGFERRLKAAAMKGLPDGLLRALKRRRYLRTLRSLRVEEEPDLAVVRHLVGPGDWVLDVGANFGLYTKFLSEAVGPGGRVVSLEPIPPTFELLRWLVARLGLANVVLIPAAASDVEAEVEMAVPFYDAGGENYYQARIVEGADAGELPRHTVRTRTLDAVAAEVGGRIAFVKCDVEGHELPALRGATGLLASSRPAWLIEVGGDPERPGPARDLFELLAREGYEPHVFDGAQLLRWAPGRRSVNVFFLTLEQLRHLEARAPALLAG